MNPSKNDFLAKDEDDEGDTCHQTFTSIGHRVCNPSLQFPFDDDKMVIIWKMLLVNRRSFMIERRLSASLYRPSGGGVK